MKKLRILYLIFTAVFLLSCSRANKEAEMMQSAGGFYDMNAPVPEMMQEERQAATEEIERKLIKDGSVEFETRSIDSTRKIVMSALEKHSGYISSDQEYKSVERTTNTLVVRVPDENFDVFIRDATTDVRRFDSRTLNVNDVTEQYIDIRARLNTKKELELRFLDLLKQARTVTEIVEIEKQLGELRSEIESVEGRLKYLESQVSYSTVTLSFYESISADDDIFGKIGNSIKGGWDAFISFLIFLVKLWPFLLLIAISLGAFRLAGRKRKTGRPKSL